MLTAWWGSREEGVAQTSVALSQAHRYVLGAHTQGGPSLCLLASHWLPGLC